MNDQAKAEGSVAPRPMGLFGRSHPTYAAILARCAPSGMDPGATHGALGRGHLRAVRPGTRRLGASPHGPAWPGSLLAATVRLHGAGRRKSAARSSPGAEGGRGCGTLHGSDRLAAAVPVWHPA